MRRRFVLLTLFVPLLAQGQIPDKKITFVRDAGRAKVVLAELGKTAGVTLDTAPQTADEVIAISVKDAGLKETLDRVARAVHGAWREDGGVYRLVRTPQQLQEEQREDWERQLKRVKEALERRRKEAQGEFTEAEAQKLVGAMRNWSKAMMESKEPYQTFGTIHTLDKRGPAGRMMTRVLETIDPAELAKLEVDERVVLSNQPTKMQRALPNGQAMVAQYLKDQATWAEALQSNPVERVVRNGTPWYMGSIGTYQQGFTVTPKKILFTARKFQGGDFYMTLMVADGNGRSLGFANSYLDVLSGEPKDTPPATPAEKDVEFQLSEEAKGAHAAFLDRVQGKGALPPELLNRLVRPETNDPLSFVVSPLLREAAAKGDANLVACLPDMTPLGSYGAATKFLREDLVRRMHVLGVVVEREEKWWIARPKERLRARVARADRTVLGNALRNVAANGRASLEDRALMASRFVPAQTNNLPRHLLSLALRPGQEADLGEDALLKFYGALDAGERARLRGGAPFGSLNPKARAALTWFIYNTEPGLTLDASKDATGVLRAFMAGVGRDTTESLPEGIPSETVVTLDDTSSEVLFAPGGQHGAYYFGARTMGADEFALESFKANNRALFAYEEWESKPPIPGRFRMGSRRRVQIKFDFTPTLDYVGMLQESGPPAAQEITFDELPPAFKKQMTERMEALRRQYTRPTGSTGGGATRPSPPPLR
ncbi:MAG: hypothetical protein ACO1SV_09310 [Fimbriimonas sp.]